MDEFFAKSNIVLLVISDMNFKSIEDFTSDDKYAHSMRNEIDNFLYSDMTMAQVCKLAKITPFFRTLGRQTCFRSFECIRTEPLQSTDNDL